MPLPACTPAGYRNYDPQAVNRLRFLRSAQNAGITLIEVRSILSIRARDEAPCVHTRSLLEAKRGEITDRLRHLEELRSELDGLLEAGRAVDADVCNPDDPCSIIACQTSRCPPSGGCPRCC